MTRQDKDIERLIVRSLDGVLSEDERYELDRQLIRDPEARQMMDDFKKIDDAAVQALRGVFSASDDAFDVDSLPDRAVVVPAPHARRRWAWMFSGAIAAAIMAIAISRTTMEPVVGPQLTDGHKAVPLQLSPIDVVNPQTPRNDIMHRVGTMVPSTRRKTGREVFGVMGDDGNIYWIEVDRSRTIRRNPREIM